jgi:hypothetical protein
MKGTGKKPQEKCGFPINTVFPCGNKEGANLREFLGFGILADVGAYKIIYTHVIELGKRNDNIKLRASLAALVL